MEKEIEQKIEEGDLANSLASNIEEDTVIIDMRDSLQCEESPLHAPDTVQVLSIPYYSLQERFPELARDRRYLLYCTNSVLSRIHAALLSTKGYSNVGIYPPESP